MNRAGLALLWLRVAVFGCAAVVGVVQWLA